MVWKHAGRISKPSLCIYVYHCVNAIQWKHIKHTSYIWKYTSHQFASSIYHRCMDVCWISMDIHTCFHKSFRMVIISEHPILCVFPFFSARFRHFQDLITLHFTIKVIFHIGIFRFEVAFIIVLDHSMYSGQIAIIPKPELRTFWGDSLTKPPFGVTSAEVVIICPDVSHEQWSKPLLHSIESWLVDRDMDPYNGH